MSHQKIMPNSIVVTVFVYSGLGLRGQCCKGPEGSKITFNLKFVIRFNTLI